MTSGSQSDMHKAWKSSPPSLQQENSRTNWKSTTLFRDIRIEVTGQTTALRTGQTDGYGESKLTRSRSPQLSQYQNILNYNWLLRAQCILAGELKIPKESRLRGAPTFCLIGLLLWWLLNNPLVHPAERERKCKPCRIMPSSLFSLTRPALKGNYFPRA